MKRKNLRYQISDWSQITECKSNNSRNLIISLSKCLDGDTLRGLILSVNHVSYGTLFAAMIKGSGKLITDKDELGNDLPFMTTEEILRQLMKFGFYIIYDVKTHLPENVFAYLSNLLTIGYDKITRVALESRDNNGNKVWRPTIIVMKTCSENEDILTFDCKVTAKVFNEKLNANSIMNVTHDKGMEWDWVSYIANIRDILDENIDSYSEFDTPIVKPTVPYTSCDPSTFTEYDSEIVDYSEDSTDNDNNLESGFTVFESEEATDESE